VGGKTEAKFPCNCPFTQLWDGQLKLSRRKKYTRNKGEGKTNWNNNNLVMCSYYPVLEDTYFHPSYLAVSKGTYGTF
jgi:hypothetical protein